jgi:hypothetical protein
MRRRDFLGFSTAAIAGTFGAGTSVIQMCFAESSPATGDRALNPNTQWLLNAKWGLFSHFLPKLPGGQTSNNMTEKMWNKKVNAFEVSRLADQLEKLKAPYFFITIGTRDNYFCSPNRAFEKQFGPGKGALTERDLVAELAAELIPRGIKLCVSLPALGGDGTVETQKMYQQVIAEWSNRWGKSISAWWIDDGKLADRAAYVAYNDAFKAGNRDALIAYNTGPLVLTYNLKEPTTDLEDFFAGQVDWYLPTCAVRAFDKKEFWVGPSFHGDQLHFLTFLGSYWGTGAPRFPDDLVVGWTKHTNNYSGTITWDVPLNNSGLIPKEHFRQLTVLSKKINS